MLHKLENFAEILNNYFKRVKIKIKRCFFKIIYLLGTHLDFISAFLFARCSTFL